ncbi:MAG: putative lipid II flippase FtsW [Oscillospiraceae bacterium]|nr:putative lipid II flippase FtsW [Oscillospiraceae bacterium]
MDLPFLVLVLTLLIFGLVMLYSASYAVGYYRFDDSAYFIKKQLLFAIVGIIVMFIAANFDYHRFHTLAWPLYGVSLVLLVVVLFTAEINGAHRWISIPGLSTVQPSEIAKFAVILVFAHMISLKYAKMKTLTHGVIPFGVALMPVVILMVLETHLSGTILIVSIGGCMMFVGGTDIRWFLLAAGIFVVGIVSAIIIKPDLVPVAMDRINMWQNPFEDVLGKNYQTRQSLLAIGSGGLTGLGLGNSRQKHLYVPEPANDFIFSIVCEELGFIGATIVILLFIALFLRGMYIAITAKDKFGAMLVVGIVFQIVLQAMLNIAVVTNTIPNTGISLPFFSHGGSSLLMLLGEIGVVLNVSRSANLEKT